MAAPENEREELIEALISGGTPLIYGTEVTFLAQAREGKAPVLLGDFNWWGSYPEAEGLAGGKMVSIAGTDWFYITGGFALDARIEYGFSDGEKERWRDPFNPNKIRTFDQDRSLLQMPDYVSPVKWLAPADRGYDGRLLKIILQKNEFEGGREVHVLLPENYPDDAPYPVAYFNDGTWYVERLSVPANIDILVREGKIRPIIGVFVAPVNRGVEYRGQPEFMDFFVNELVPLIDGDYETVAAPEGRAIMGGSRGGLGALNLAWRNDGVFGFCGMLEPAITPTNILNQVWQGPTKSIRFNVVGGTYDPRFIGDYHNVVDTLLGKGYSVKNQTASIGHSPNSWKYYIPEMLMDFFPANR